MDINAVENWYRKRKKTSLEKLKETKTHMESNIAALRILPSANTPEAKKQLKVIQDTIPTFRKTLYYRRQRLLETELIYAAALVVDFLENQEMKVEAAEVKLAANGIRFQGNLDDITVIFQHHLNQACREEDPKRPFQDFHFNLGEHSADEYSTISIPQTYRTDLSISINNRLLMKNSRLKETLAAVNAEMRLEAKDQAWEPKIDWFREFTDRLRDYSDGDVWTDGNQILAKTKEGADTMADLLCTLYRSQGEDFIPATGYYDPEEDKKQDAEDRYTGWYYVAAD